MKQFWKSWKKKTKIEEDAIKVLNKAKKIILKDIKKANIISIYVGGSFVRREMNKDSDVDTWVVTREVPSLIQVKRLGKKYKLNPKVGFSGYTLWELRHGKKAKQLGEPRRGPQAFMSEVNDYHLIYGEDLSRCNFPSKDPKVRAKELVNVFYKIFLPSYKKGKMDLQELIKQVFWLTYYELKTKGEQPKHSFKDIAKLTHKNHIAKYALIYRKSDPKNPKAKIKFITKLEKHLKGLKRRYK
jgi:predicted nucleotidyltransferase